MALGGTVLIFGSAVAQQSKLPVGVVDVVNRPIIERTEFLGRIQEESVEIGKSLRCIDEFPSVSDVRI